jgi:hypothetical protein
MMREFEQFCFVRAVGDAGQRSQLVFNIPIERTSKSGVGHNNEFYGWDGKFDYTAGLPIIAGVVRAETRRELRTECGSY